MSSRCDAICDKPLVPTPHQPQMALPAELPILPVSEQPWSPHVHNAAQIVGDLYSGACSVLGSGNFNLHCIQHHFKAITDEALPLLLQLEDHTSRHEPGGDQLDPWLQACALLFGELLVKLAEAESTICNMCVYFAMNAGYLT